MTAHIRAARGPGGGPPCPPNTASTSPSWSWEAGAQLVELRGVHSGTTPEVGPRPCSSTSVRVPP